jgi:DNA repair protein RecO (recombination protein O)
MSQSTLHHTRGIVLRSVKYGETSLIVTIFTELFGTQSYIINGVRSGRGKQGAKAQFFQPGSILELVVYHNEFKTLHRIKEYKWAVLYQHLFFDVVKHSVGLFMVELLQKTLRQPDPNPDLYYFIEDAFLHLDEASGAIVAHYPIFFATHLTYFFGFRISDTYDELHTTLDLQEGAFVADVPLHPHHVGVPYTEAISKLLKVMTPDDLSHFQIPTAHRRVILQAYLTFYGLHVEGFGSMKTVGVLQEVL